MTFIRAYVMRRIIEKRQEARQAFAKALPTITINGKAVYIWQGAGE